MAVSTAKTISTSASAVIGLYRIAPDGACCPRRRHRRNQSQPRGRSTTIAACAFADDLDITDDGLIFFSEGDDPLRDDEWARRRALEARGNGRIICYDTNTGRTHTADPRTEVSERHLQVASDGQSISVRRDIPPAAPSSATGSTVRRRAQSRS